MFPTTITIHNPTDLQKVLNALYPTIPADAPDTAATKEAAALKGKPSAAKTAPSQPTAEADPSPSAQPDAAPATQTTDTKPAATAPSTTVAYPDLQKAVLTLHKMDPTAAVPIAKSLGADSFKLLPDTKWAEALRLVNAAIEARKAG